jgi:tetratricopeptide (TPR) repeat protein
LQNAKGLEGFSAYNLGIALWRSGQQEEGGRQFDRAGQINGNEPGALAIRDKSNLVFGSTLLENKQPELARNYLERVRLQGPYSNRALLAAGWADASLERYDRALVPWTILSQRKVTDKAVQEGLLAVPFAYRKLNAYGKAARLYESALHAFGNELDKLASSIRSIREGKFLQALVREEVRQDSNWVVKLRNLPDSPETYYLTELMASHDFQSSLKNYLDLEELRKRLVVWEDDLDAYEQLIGLRRAYYQPLLPDIDKAFRVLDSQMRLRLEQRARVAARIKAMLVSPRPERHTAEAGPNRDRGEEASGQGARGSPRAYQPPKRCPALAHPYRVRPAPHRSVQALAGAGCCCGGSEETIRVLRQNPASGDAEL